MNFINLKSKHNRIVLVSLFVITAWVIPAHAVDDVRVTNFPTSYAVTNTTWDQKLATITTTLQTQSANISTLVNRFGWNGTYTFSQGFELLYDDVHSLATSTSGSDYLTAFNREFPAGTPPTASTMKYYMRQNYVYTTYIHDDLTSLGTQLGSVVTSSSNIDTSNASIDSKMTTTNSRLNNMLTNWTPYFSNISSKANSIKVDTGNISVDTEHISGTQDILVSQSAITMNNVSILRNFFADDDTLAQKAAAEQASDSALNNFTGNGYSAASASDYVDISNSLTAVNGTFQTGNINKNIVLQLIEGQGQYNSAWAWFSQETYDSINPSNRGNNDLNANYYLAMYEELSNDEMRKGSDTPYLDAYYEETNKALGVK